MNFYQEKLNQIKIALGMEVKMAEATLEDGVTKVEAEAFEAGKKIYVVSESGEKGPAPEGTHTTEDGTKVTVDAEGTITAVEEPKPKVEVEIEATAVVEDPAKEEAPVPTEGDIMKEDMKKLVMQCMEAIEEVAKEVAVVKEEMASYKSKMEKMSATPASTKISTFNTESPEPFNAIEARLESLKALRSGK
jgi:hypothetical protein